MKSNFCSVALFAGEPRTTRSRVQKVVENWFTAAVNKAVEEVVERLRFSTSQRWPAQALLLGKVRSNLRIERRVRERVVFVWEELSIFPVAPRRVGNQR